MDVEFTGSNSDMHSGEHGGIAFNPIHALIQTLGKLRDSAGKIMVPGFYDEVLNWPLQNFSSSQQTLIAEEYKQNICC